MTVIEDTIIELMTTNITKWVDRPTHASVETMQKELTKKAAAIKTRYDAFLLGTRFCYVSVIMLTEDYKERVYKIEPLELADIWSFKPPEQPEAYDPSIDGKTASVKVAKLEAAWENATSRSRYLPRRRRCATCCLEEIEDEII